jgi:hypothetical protein
LAFRKQESVSRRSALRENLKRIAGEEGRALCELILHPEIQGIFSLLRDPYEWRTAAAYAAERKDIFLKAVDLSVYSREKLGNIPELVAVENLRVLLRAPGSDLGRQSASIYRQARALFLDPPAEWTVTEESRIREAHMAGVIGRLVRRADGRKVLHIGGWEHLVESPGGDSIYERLKHLRPERRLLGEVEDSREEDRLPARTSRGSGRKNSTKTCEKAVKKTKPGGSNVL